MNSPKTTKIKSGVYQIRNRENGRCYYGSTNSFTRRYGNHASKLRNGIHENGNLQQAYDEYGNDAFAFEILFHVADEAVMHRIEDSYLDESVNSDLYNVSKSFRGGSFTLDQHPNGEAIRRKLSVARTGRKLSAATRDKLGHQKRGEKNKLFTGYYVTPLGKFASSYAAGAAFAGLMVGRTLQVVCKKPDTIIGKRSYDHNGYLKSIGPSVIGKRWSDLGFSFEPASAPSEIAA